MNCFEKFQTRVFINTTHMYECMYKKTFKFALLL